MVRSRRGGSSGLERVFQVAEMAVCISKNPINQVGVPVCANRNAVDLAATPNFRGI
jgi:hypothetical protein